MSRRRRFRWWPPLWAGHHNQGGDG